MDEKRSASRWVNTEGLKSNVLWNDTKEAVSVADISTAGMRIVSSQPISVGEAVYGKVMIPFNSATFYIRGRIVRVNENNKQWESGIKFEKVSVRPFPGVEL